MALNEVLKSVKEELHTGGDLFSLYHTTLEQVAKQVLTDAGLATDVQQDLAVKIANLYLAKMSTAFVEPSDPIILTPEEVAADYQEHKKELEHKNEPESEVDVPSSTENHSE